jgi:hypothetical protein
MVSRWTTLSHHTASLLVAFGALITGSLSAPDAYAQTVFKCVDAAGKVTFTANANCPSNNALEDVVSAHNPTISRTGEETLMATPKSRSAHYYRIQAAPRAARPSARQVGCSTGLGDQDLRKAKVQGVVKPGMTRAEVESIYGSATDKRSAGAGSTTYWSDHYKQAFNVNFDSNGCVRSTNSAGYKP